MNFTRYAMMNMVKNIFKWVFFCVLYPYMVVSLVYGEGVSVSALLFSYITIMPTLLTVKWMIAVREKSIDLNEYLSKISQDKMSYETYEKTIIGLKVGRKILLVLLALFFIKVLLTVFNISTFISPSLNAFLIALLQLYYIAIVVAHVKYEV